MLTEMKLKNLIVMFRELEDGKSLQECQKGFKKEFGISFIYMKSKNLEKEGIIQLTINKNNRRAKLVKLTAKGKKLKKLFYLIDKVVGKGTANLPG